MLVLSRRRDDTVVVMDPNNAVVYVTITVADIRGDKVRLGFEANPSVRIYREEVWRNMQAQTGPSVSITEGLADIKLDPVPV